MNQPKCLTILSRILFRGIIGSKYTFRNYCTKVCSLTKLINCETSIIRNQNEKMKAIIKEYTPSEAHECIEYNIIQCAHETYRRLDNVCNLLDNVNRHDLATTYWGHKSIISKELMETEKYAKNTVGIIGAFEYSSSNEFNYAIFRVIRRSLTSKYIKLCRSVDMLFFDGKIN